MGTGRANTDLENIENAYEHRYAEGSLLSDAIKRSLTV
jgi:hypothetical protein